MKYPNKISPTHQTLIRSLGASALLAMLASSPVIAGTDAVDSKSSKDKNPVLTAAPKSPRFYLTLSGGAEVDYNATKFTSNGGGHLLGEPAHVSSRYFPHLHDGETQLGEVTAGYIINPVVSVFGRFDYNHSFKTREEIGSVRDVYGVFGAKTSANIPLSADLDNYHSYGGKAGVKLSLPPLPNMAWTTFLKPYVTFAAGGTYVGATNANLALDAGTPAADYLGGYGLYRSSWVFSTDGRVGIEYDITKNVAINLEGGLGYDTKLQRAHNKGKRASTESLGLTGISQGGDRLYSPLTVGVKFSF